jgi:hypothetical protein
MILSENDFDNQLLALACACRRSVRAGQPAYSLLSQDHASSSC